MSTTAAADAVSIDELVERSRLLRRELAAEGARVDSAIGDTALGMKRCFEEQLMLISLPRAYGGLSDGTVRFAAEALLEIQTNLSASDSSLGQNWITNQLVVRELFAWGNEHLPDATLRKLAADVLEGKRFVASNSGAGVTTHVTAREVPGGIRISGVKSFNSNSGGEGYAVVGFEREGFPGRYQAIVRLDDPGVRKHGDWDNMGQRGTCSQTITYEDIFVANGWHFPVTQFDPRYVALVFLTHGALMLGSALGAHDAGLDHLRGTNRVLLPRFANSMEDPLMMRRVGSFSGKLRAAHVLQQHVARALQEAGTAEQASEVVVDALRAKSVCLETSLEVTQGLFELAGARMTSNRHRLDRFWRNARTFACHDALDVLQVWVGAWDLNRTPPNILEQVRYLQTGKRPASTS